MSQELSLKKILEKANHIDEKYLITRAKKIFPSIKKGGGMKNQKTQNNKRTKNQKTQNNKRTKRMNKKQLKLSSSRKNKKSCRKISKRS